MQNNVMANRVNIINNQCATDPLADTLVDISVISVFEHQRLTVNDFADSTDFDWLLTQEFAVFSIRRQRGQWQLKVGHYIGVIILPSNMILEILPKPIAGDKHSNRSVNIARSNDLALTRRWLQTMLSDLFNSTVNQLPTLKNLGQISQDLQPLSISAPPLSLSQWLIVQFLQGLSAYKPTQHYQAHIQNQTLLQGKLLIKEQLRRNSTQPHKLVSEVSILSQDMLSNRLIKTALWLLQPLLMKSAANLMIAWQPISALNPYELRQLDTLYVQAWRQLVTQPLPRRQLQGAQQLLNLAYWLLQMQQPNIETGSSLDAQSLSHQSLATPLSKQPRLCLLINMNQAFEQWASQRIAMAFTQMSTEFKPLYQSRRVWLSDSAGQACLSIQPDLLIYRTGVDDTSANEIKAEKFTKAIKDKTALNHALGHALDHVLDSDCHCSHVIDIKWKHLAQTSDISASDAYQLLSYAQAYQAEQVWLVYPVTDDSYEPVALRQQGVANYATLWLMPFNVITGKLNRLSTDIVDAVDIA